MANPANVPGDLSKLETDTAQESKDQSQVLADQTILAADDAALVAQKIGYAVFTADSPPAGIVGTFYGYQFLASNSPIFSVLSGNLPSGLVLSNTGLLSGTPTTAQTYTFVVGATVGTLIAETGAISIAISGTAPVIVAPVEVSPPVISGNPQVGQILVTTNGVFD